jgi:hypothetical protein
LFWRPLECTPSWCLLSQLLVDHQNDRQHVLYRRRFGIKPGPQEAFQVVCELEHPDLEPTPCQFSVQCSDDITECNCAFTHTLVLTVETAKAYPQRSHPHTISNGRLEGGREHTAR